MKKIFFLLILFTILGIIPAFANNTGDITSYDTTMDIANIHTCYGHIQSPTWNKYFKSQAKKLKKSWKKNKNLFITQNYKTSYARIMFAVNKKGEILASGIKSSCIPCNDKIFLKEVNKTIDSIEKFDVLPSNYNYDYVIFTVKLHTNLPDRINAKNINWQRYGIADIEIDKNNTVVIIK